MRRRFVTLDVFTTRRFAGNPLAVVLDPDGLDTAAMQTIAREFNLSETVFVFPPADKANRAKLRIFTPVPNCPLPAIRRSGRRCCSDASTAAARDFTLEEQVGLVPCRVTSSARTAERVVRHPRLPSQTEAAPMPPRSPWRSACRDRHRVRWLVRSGGRRESRYDRAGRAIEAVARCRPDLARFEAAFGGDVAAPIRRSAVRRAEPVTISHAHVRARRRHQRGSGDRSGGGGFRGLSGGEREIPGRRAPRAHRAGLRDGTPELMSSR